MDLHRTAAIATILATAIAVWQFVGMAPSAGTALPSVLSEEKASIDLTLDVPVYKGERNWLLAMYEAAIAMPYSTSKSDALKKVVKACIQAGDFNLAVIAAKKSPYSQTKAEMLDEIVNAATLSKETIGYAVLAAENMPYSSSKASALERIIASYGTFSKKQEGKKAGETLPANKIIQPTATSGG